MKYNFDEAKNSKKSKPKSKLKEGLRVSTQFLTLVDNSTISINDLIRDMQVLTASLESWKKDGTTGVKAFGNEFIPVWAESTKANKTPIKENKTTPEQDNYTTEDWMKSFDKINSEAKVNGRSIVPFDNVEHWASILEDLGIEKDKAHKIAVDVSKVDPPRRKPRSSLGY